MKGKATLTLCDAATGTVVQSAEQNVIVTDAVSRLFNPPWETLADTNRYEQMDAMLPMWKNILGGVILLGNTLEESKDNIMLREDCVPVGTAGDAYSGTNAIRGSLNADESYETENGYHFTWDFSADKANGTINSIALTSRYFGNAGFAACETRDGTLVVNPYNLNNLNNFNQTPNFMKLAQNYFIGSFKPRELLFASSSATNIMTTVTFKKFRTPNANALMINDRVLYGDSGNITPAEIVELVLEYKVDNLKNIFWDPKNRDLYIFAPVSHSSLSGSEYPYRGTVRYWRIDPDTLTIKEFSSVKFPKSGVGAVLSCAVYDGIFYAVTASEGTYKVNMTTNELIEVLPLTTQNPSRFYVTETGLMYNFYERRGSYGSASVFRRVDADTGFICDGPFLSAPVYTDWIPKPYCLFSLGDLSTASVLLMTNYLAAVGNLAQPLTKTNAQTLKISFDIIN